MNDALKTCSRCSHSKALDEFRLLKSGRRTSHCKSCAKEYLNEWRAKNAEELRNRRRLQYGNMTEDQREAKREADRRHYVRAADRQRNSRMVARFGITLAEYDEMLEAQNNACAICFESCGSGRRLAIDHCHKSGKVRGLLCIRCNNGIGNFLDDTKRLLSAVEYLNTHAKERANG